MSDANVYELDEAEQPERTEEADLSEDVDRSETSQLADFASFRTMMIPLFIIWAFWLGAFFGLAFALARLVAAIRDSESLMAAKVVVAFIIGGGLWRGICELTILFFRMNETLTLILNVLRKKR
jgi:hypothetical protein